MKKRIIAASILGAVTLSYLVNSAVNANMPSGNYEQEKPAPFTSADAVYYYQGYKANAVAMQEKLNKGYIIVRGTVLAVRINLNNKAEIQLDDGSIANMRIEMREAEKERITEINIGDSVTIQAESSKFRFETVFMSNGRLIRQ